MKRIVAYVRSFKHAAVLSALDLMGLREVHVIEVQGFGREALSFYAQEKEGQHLRFTTHTRIEVLCQDDRVERTVDSIRAIAHTGRVGDGLIAVRDTEVAHDIRDQEPASEVSR